MASETFVILAVLLVLNIALLAKLFYKPIKSTFTYCPHCSRKLVWGFIEDKERLKCPNPRCTFVHWNNPLPVVATLIPHKGQLVLVRRAIPPKQGLLGLPAGFMEPFESPEEAAKRESGEEAHLFNLNLDSRPLFAWGVPNRNEILIVYLAKETDDIPEHGSDASAIILGSIDELPNFIANGKIAFDLHKDAIVYWLTKQKDSSPN